LLPVAASTQASPIDQLFGLLFKIIAFIFALIVGLMLYSIIVFRRKSGDDTDAVHIEGNTRLEVFLTVIPLGVVLLSSPGISGDEGAISWPGRCIATPGCTWPSCSWPS
jgi:heme/copper-type cytochrome/quinol oxidase subunit 2